MRGKPVCDPIRTFRPNFSEMMMILGNPMGAASFDQASVGVSPTCFRTTWAYASTLPQSFEITWSAAGGCRQVATATSSPREHGQSPDLFPGAGGTARAQAQSGCRRPPHPRQVRHGSAIGRSRAQNWRRAPCERHARRPRTGHVGAPQHLDVGAAAQRSPSCARRERM